MACNTRLFPFALCRSASYTSFQQILLPFAKGQSRSRQRIPSLLMRSPASNALRCTEPTPDIRLQTIHVLQATAKPDITLRPESENEWVFRNAKLVKRSL